MSDADKDMRFVVVGATGRMGVALEYMNLWAALRMRTGERAKAVRHCEVYRRGVGSIHYRQRPVGRW
jgi:hypothetical protein